MNVRNQLADEEEAGMDKHEKSHPSHDEMTSPHQGKKHHGWSPDVDGTRQEDNDSAHRSFHPDTYAPDTGTTRKSSPPDEQVSPPSEVDSVSRRGEKRARKPEKGTHDTGPRGASQRPSGSRDTSGRTGVDPQEPRDPKDR